MLNGEKNIICKMFSLYNHYSKCKEFVFPFSTVRFEQLLVMIKRICQTYHLTASPFSCFLEGVFAVDGLARQGFQYMYGLLYGRWRRRVERYILHLDLRSLLRRLI